MGLELPLLLVFSALAVFAVESVTSSHVFALFGLSKSQPELSSALDYLIGSGRSWEQSRPVYTLIT